MPKRLGMILTWTSKTPEPLEATRGWRHTPTAEAVGMRLVAVLSIRPSAPRRKAVNRLKADKQLAVMADTFVPRAEADVRGREQRLAQIAKRLG
mgnify:CR=1 FL=1